jgi:hypothetical protein
MEELLDKLFGAARVSPWHPEFPERVRALAHDPVLRAEALRLIGGMEEGPAWFWKEPNLCHCLPFFMGIIPSPLLAVAIRNPYESALSYEKFVLPSTLQGTIRLRSLYVLRWQHFMVSILEHAVHHPSVIYLHYVELVNCVFRPSRTPKPAHGDRRNRRMAIGAERRWLVLLDRSLLLPAGGPL